MRTVLIAVALAGLTACSLYFSDHPTQIGRPDAGPSSDGGHYYPDAPDPSPDAGLDAPQGGGGCDAGSTLPDAPCCQQWPDAAPPVPDAYGP